MVCTGIANFQDKLFRRLRQLAFVLPRQNTLLLTSYRQSDVFMLFTIHGKTKEKFITLDSSVNRFLAN